MLETSQDPLILSNPHNQQRNFLDRDPRISHQHQHQHPPSQKRRRIWSLQLQLPTSTPLPTLDPVTPRKRKFQPRVPVYPGSPATKGIMLYSHLSVLRAPPRTHYSLRNPLVGERQSGRTIVSYIEIEVVDLLSAVWGKILSPSLFFLSWV